ncbi:MAG: hypothetical protein M1828_003928 [Chrysothrix sp. TS-e1954]|nr:MAG: hypothetical protein M1828_003928 [Chrysothrix sp. TS-e1954]
MPRVIISSDDEDEEAGFDAQTGEVDSSAGATEDGMTHSLDSSYVGQDAEQAGAQMVDADRLHCDASPTRGAGDRKHALPTNVATPVTKRTAEDSYDTIAVESGTGFSRLKRRKVSAPCTGESRRADSTERWDVPGSGESAKQGTSRRSRSCGAQSTQDVASTVMNNTSSLDRIGQDLEASRSEVQDGSVLLDLRKQHDGAVTSARKGRAGPVVLIPQNARESQRSTEGTPRRTKRRKTETLEEIDELSSDFHTDLPPKEQYVPRPSRSRSAQGPTAGPAKQDTRAKRTRSEGHAVEKQLRELKGMGFGSQEARSAVEKAGGDLHKAVDLLVRQGEEEADEEPSPDIRDAREKSNDAGPRTKDTKNTPNEQQQQAPPTHLEQPPNDIQPKTRPTPARSSSPPHQNQPPHQTSPATNPAPANPQPEPKKKARGRPKKTQPDIQPLDEGPSEPQGVEIPAKRTNKSEPTKSPSQPLQSTTPNPKSRAPEPKDDPDGNGDDAQDLSVPPAKEQSATHQTPPPASPKQYQEDKVSPVRKHSPLKKGGMQHRVGLSRRVQIEPLLKVRRKG